MRFIGRWLSASTLACALIACQAVSGLDRLKLVGSDAGAIRAAPECDAAASCSDAGEPAAGTTCQIDSDCGSSACVEGLCTQYCSGDADCASGRCHTTALRTAAGVRLQACQQRCDFTTQAPCAQGAQCAHFGEGDETAGDYCVVPSAKCETDGLCDEPVWGTRRCVAGSDAADCACAPRILSASCDLIEQCGCAPGSHCALADVQGSSAELGCVVDRLSAREPGAACNAEAECPAGYSCWRGLCEKYCASASECDSGDCVAVRNPDEVNGLSLCDVACDFDANSGCLSGTQCARAPDGKSYCVVPRWPCPFQNDGVCDEPQGTRLCIPGSDEADCS